jgi:TatD DNase family protein
MTLIDTHCHLYSEKFKNDLDATVARAKENGIGKIFLPAIDTESHAALIELSEKKYEGVEILPMMGLHPCSIKQNFEEELAIIRTYLDGDKKFYAVGEIGLDYYWDLTFKEQQIIAFERQIEWSIEKNLPIVIHSRKSTPDCIASVSKYAGKAKGIFHCFSGTLEEAKEIIGLGFYLGIGGVVTYTNSNLKEILKQTGLKNVVLETDAPYLAPIPYKGKRNEPAYVKNIAEQIAVALNKSVERVAEMTTENAMRVFQINN